MSRLADAAAEHEQALRELAGLLAAVLDSRWSSAHVNDREAIVDHLVTLGYDDSDESWSYLNRIVSGTPSPAGVLTLRGGK